MHLQFSKDVPKSGIAIIEADWKKDDKTRTKTVFKGKVFLSGWV